MTRHLNDRNPWTWFQLLVWFLFCSIGLAAFIAWVHG